MNKPVSLNTLVLCNYRSTGNNIKSSKPKPEKPTTPTASLTNAPVKKKKKKWIYKPKKSDNSSKSNTKAKLTQPTKSATNVSKKIRINKLTKNNTNNTKNTNNVENVGKKSRTNSSLQAMKVKSYKLTKASKIAQFLNNPHKLYKLSLKTVNFTKLHSRIRILTKIVSKHIPMHSRNLKTTIIARKRRKLDSVTKTNVTPVKKSYFVKSPKKKLRKKKLTASFRKSKQKNLFFKKKKIKFNKNINHKVIKKSYTSRTPRLITLRINLSKIKLKLTQRIKSKTSTLPKSLQKPKTTNVPYLSKPQLNKTKSPIQALATPKTFNKTSTKSSTSLVKFLIKSNRHTVFLQRLKFFKKSQNMIYVNPNNVRFNKSNLNQSVKLFTKSLYKSNTLLTHPRNTYLSNKLNSTAIIQTEWVRQAQKKVPSLTRRLNIYGPKSSAASSFVKRYLAKWNYNVQQQRNSELNLTIIKRLSIEAYDNFINSTPHRILSHQSTYANLINYSTSLSTVSTVLKLHSTDSLVLHKLPLNFSRSPNSDFNVQSVTALESNTTSLAKLKLPSIVETTPLTPALSQWLFERMFTSKKNVISRSSTLVLSRVPDYKMDWSSPVTADRFRGNVYSRLGLDMRLDGSFVNKFQFAMSNIAYRLPTFDFIAHTSNNATRINPTLHYLKSKNNWLNISATSDTYLLRQNLFTKELSMLKYAPQRQITLRAMFSERPKNFIINNKKALKLQMQLTLFTKAKKSKIRNKFKNKSRNSFKRRQKQKIKFFKKLTIRIRRWYLKYTRRIQKINNKLKRFAWWKIKRKKLLRARFSRLQKRRRLAISQLLSNHQNKHTSADFFLRRSAPETNYYNLNSTKNYRPKVIRIRNQFSAIYANGISFSNKNMLLAFALNTLLFKDFMFKVNTTTEINNCALPALWKNLESFAGPLAYQSNLVPHSSFNQVISKKVLNSFTNRSFQTNLVPWYHNTLIRFIENCSGRKALFQFYPFINQEISREFAVRYYRWLPRMTSYERNLGHRFFLEEALHIMHLSFYLRDPKIIASWLKAMILRISFWRTRSIFRFLKYLFHNYFRHVFPDINIQGLKIRLKGKISAAGNSRKRTILYRIGKTSHSQTSLRVLTEFSTINTFTGVMGFSVWLFY